jgi:hypothetical protein
MNAGRVTRSSIVSGLWQSMHDTGCSTSLRASWYFIWFIASKPFTMSPPPSFLNGTYTDAWQFMQVPGCCTTT